MRSNDLDKQEIIKCFHCGNETPMPKAGEYSWGSRDLEYSDIDFLNKYELFACPVCHKVTLRHSYGDETMIHYHNYDEVSYYDEKSILYDTYNRMDKSLACCLLTIDITGLLAPGENRHFEPGENNQFQPGRNRQSVPGGCSQPRFECRF